MALRIPDLLQYEMHHRLERWRAGMRRLNLRGWINAHPVWVIGIASVAAVLLILALVRVLKPSASASFQQGKSAWFYDTNTSQLFVGSSRQSGPIPAPSGPLPAGFRAHVYSYVLDPNESELFVGFLERPDPAAGAARSAHDMSDFQAWARGRLVRRADDKKWVAATSPEGQAILQQMLSPNEKGQTPLYQTPRP